MYDDQNKTESDVKEAGHREKQLVLSGESIRKKAFRHFGSVIRSII